MKPLQKVTFADCLLFGFFISIGHFAFELIIVTQLSLEANFLEAMKNSFNAISTMVIFYFVHSFANKD